MLASDGVSYTRLPTQMALKFEHKNSKGCNFGPPYEWSVYSYAFLTGSCCGVYAAKSGQVCKQYQRMGAGL